MMVWVLAIHFVPSEGRASALLRGTGSGAYLSETHGQSQVSQQVGKTLQIIE